MSNASTVFNAFSNAFHELGRAIAPPAKVEHHFLEARKHMLLGLREMIDHRIEKISRAQEKGTRVPVD